MGAEPTGGRRPAVDVARILALGVVVLGHLTLAVIDRGPDGAVRGANLLELRPGWAWLAVLSPMPVFFAAAGWANLRSDPASVAPRLRTLIGLGAVVVCAWVAAAGLTHLVAGESGAVGDGARIATQPLWFLAAYVPLAASAPAIARVARRPALAVGCSLALLVVLDAARFAGGAPDWIGWPGFAAAWATPWVLGAWWRARCESSTFDERRVGALLAVGGAMGATVLVRTAGYSPALIDAVEGARSNTTPPTLYTAVVAIGQVGLFMVVAGALDRIGRRWEARWRQLGAAAVGVYVLHLSALALCAGVVALGLGVPERLSGWWWATRPLWWAAVLGVTGLLVAASASLRSVLVRRGRSRSAGPPRRWSRGFGWSGVALATVGAAVVGLRGPRTLPLALICVVSFVGSWWALGRAGGEEGSWRS